MNLTTTKIYKILDYRISSPISRDPESRGLSARLKVPPKKVKPSAISRERNY